MPTIIFILLGGFITWILFWVFKPFLELVRLVAELIGVGAPIVLALGLVAVGFFLLRSRAGGSENEK